MSVLKQFLNNDLQLNPDSEGMIIEREHRLGRKTRMRFSKRPIIAAFNNYSGTEKIRKNARLLRGTRSSVDRDYPAEITNARKLLWPRFKELRQNKRQRDTVEIRYPAQLVKNNVVIEDAFPGWNDIMKGNKISPSVRNSNESNTLSSGNAPTHYQSQYSWDNRLKSAAYQSSRPRGQRIDELTWDKQPEYEMDAHSGIWGSETLHWDNSDSRGKRKSERLRDLESQLETQRKALRQLEDECESERQYERQNQTKSRDLSGSIDTDRHLEHTRGGGISSERHLEREKCDSAYQRQSGQTLFQRQTENQSQARSSSEHGRQIERQSGERQREKQSEHSYHSASEVTPDVRLECTRRVSPGILDQMRQFENKDNINESSTTSIQDSDDEFYTQYVQGTNPRSFGGLPTESNESKDDKISIGGDDTVKGPSGDESGSELQTMADKGPSGGENERGLQNMVDKETVNI